VLLLLLSPSLFALVVSRSIFVSYSATRLISRKCDIKLNVNVSENCHRTLSVNQIILLKRRVHLPVTYFLFRDKPFIWCSRFPRRCAQNMELQVHTSSHPPIPNISSFRRHLKTYYFLSAHLAP